MNKILFLLLSCAVLAFSYKNDKNAADQVPDNIEAITCNNWLSTPSHPSGVTVGDLDVTGNQLTVEALFYRSSAFDPTFNFGKLVSKHTTTTNVNYSLMPVTCEITTTAGYINTPAVCPLLLDRIYHVAMVYDGAVLKFYRNGYLLSSIAWTGNLINNNLLTTIGNGSTFPSSAFQHTGYINEVRIWNIARTQTEIKAYMNNSLPSPTTTPGLLAYYTFDNLLNKQGNAAFNGTLSGPATINVVAPDCNFLIDSCSIILPVRLVNFEGSENNCSTRLKWKVSRDSNADQFEIEQSKDGERFASAAIIPAVPGQEEYEWKTGPVSGRQYYRLKLKDLDGNTSLSKIVQIKSSCEYPIELFRIYPNPATTGTVQIEFYRAGQYSIQLTNLAGATIRQQQITTTAGQILRFDNLRYPPGMYLVRITETATKNSQDLKLMIR